MESKTNLNLAMTQTKPVVRAIANPENQALPAKQQLNRSLEARHMNMIAIGGAIGTGIFVASGASISMAGPGGAVLAYMLIGIMVYFLMTGLGEMATYLPVSGAFGTYAGRFVDSALGFAIGWNYWLSWAVCLAVELIAGAMIMKFWFPGLPSYIWSAFFLVLLFGLNYLSTRAYGESEFWFAGIKVMTVIIFLFVGILVIGGAGGTESPGFSNWHQGEAPFVGGFGAILSIFMIAGFSFQGTEMVGIAAGESKDPEKNIPQAINSVFWRIILFYIGTLLVIGFILPYTDENLLKNGIENIAVSPFTLVFSRLGLTFAASVMNAVILTAVLSAGSSSLYASSRMLYAMALEGKAPRIFTHVNKQGVPVNALWVTALFGLLAFLSAKVGDGVAYQWLLNATGVMGFITWMGIAISHYRFRRAFTVQNYDINELKYKAKWFPFGPVFALAVCFIVIVGQNYSAFIGRTVNWHDIAVAYIGIPVFIFVYLFYKFTKKTKLISLEDIDLRRE